MCKKNHRLLLGLYLSLITGLGFAADADKSLAIFIGHSQWDKGSQELDLPAEWDYCSKLAGSLIQLAPAYHVQAKRFFRGQGGYKEAVSKMHREKNRWVPNVTVISCHYNSTPITLDNTQLHAAQLRALFANGQKPKKGSLMGTLVLYKPTAASKILAEKLLRNMTMIMPRQDTGFNHVSGIVPISTEDRGAREILSEDQSPVMLLEIGYGDNPVDSTLMKAPGFQKAVAEAILKTIVEQDK